MYTTHPYRKIALCLTGIVIALLCVIALMASTRTTSPVVTQVAPPGVAEVANAPAQCNPLMVALGGCK